MHRSGTSAVARIAGAFGLAQARTLMAPAPDNPHGFFESVPLTRLDDHVLAALGRRWDDPRPVAIGKPELASLTPLVDEGVRLLAEEFPGDGNFVLKDPRMARLAPFWRRVFERARVRVRWLYVVRNPVEVALSLAARNGLGVQQAQLLWLAHVFEFFAAVNPRDVAVVSFADCRDGGKMALEGAFAYLGLAPPAVPEARDAAGLVDGDSIHHRAGTDALLLDPAYSEQAKHAYVALLDATRRPEAIASDLFRRLGADVRRAWHVLSPTLAPLGFPAQPDGAASADTASPGPVAAGEPLGVPTTIPGWTDPGRRRVVVHYHLFKNAGTSLDESLRGYFGDRWINVEAPEGQLLPAALAGLIASYPDRVVFSSHTVAFPAPDVEGCAILPVVFVRHPIDRIRSIYQFERRQEPANTPGAVKAKALDFRGYVDWRLGHDNLIRNYHVSRFSAGAAKRNSLPHALDYMTSLPFIGVVEQFDESLGILERYLREAFADARLAPRHSNVTRERGATLAERLQATREELGEALYRSLVELNEDDLQLYRWVCQRMGFDESLAAAEAAEG